MRPTLGSGPTAVTTNANRLLASGLLHFDFFSSRRTDRHKVESNSGSNSARRLQGRAKAASLRHPHVQMKEAGELGREVEGLGAPLKAQVAEDALHGATRGSRGRPRLPTDWTLRHRPRTTGQSVRCRLLTRQPNSPSM